ncbi:CaiB/BaiF CoA-transferase family protein [Sphingomonas sp. 37zxx]|uniref:CaiB/BaiF CoA-transferase family protein n=1 Tax=Sphingomonas sp. 37zxx TaxID=1550073 RepID=UPI00053BF091|nr:CoA transferase [Sphingomonas sp. 37zxx]
MTQARRRLRIAEITTTTAGMACGRIFAALGHDVIRLETDAVAGTTDRPFTRAALNGGKRCLPAGPSIPQALLEHVAQRADILLLDAPAGQAGFPDAAILAARSSGLITVSVTAFGLSGACAGMPNHSLLAEAHSGFMTMIGEPDRAPLMLGGEQSAYATAWTAFFGAMLAVLRRDKGAGGDLVEVSQSDVAAYMDWKSDVMVFHSGKAPNRTGAHSGWWRIVKAADGFVAVVFTPDQWHQLVELVDDPRMRVPELADPVQRLKHVDRAWAVMGDVFAARTAHELYLSAQALGLPFGYAATVADLLADPQFQSRGFVLPPAARRKDAPIVALPLPMPGLDQAQPVLPQPDLSALAQWPLRPDFPITRADVAPLAGVSVIDFGVITAGAGTGRLLADYGADVLKVESHDRPDPFRKWQNPVEEPQAEQPRVSPLFASNNSGKRGLFADMKTPHGRALVRRKCRSADIVLENFRVGVTARLGIDFPTLKAENAELIYLSLSSQGQEGPEARYSSYGSTLDMLTGLGSMTGYAGGDPIWSSGAVNYPDQVVSMAGAALIAHSLVIGARGLHLDVSQRELVTWTLADVMAEFAFTGAVPQRTGNRRPWGAPHNSYRTDGDGWLALVCTTDAERAALARLIGGLPQDATGQWWHDNADASDAVIAAWAQRHGRDAAVALLNEAGVPAMPVRTAADRARDPRYRDRRLALVDTDWIKGFPLILHRYAPSVPAPPPELGEDVGPGGTDDAMPMPAQVPQ